MTRSSRTLRAGLTIVLTVCALSVPAPAATQALDYVRTEVAEGVHVYLSPDPGAGNAYLIVSRGEALLVDATASPRSAESIAADLERLGALTLKGIVYTHWHPDHIWGTQAFTRRFPDTPVLSHHRTEEDIRQNAIPDLAVQIERIHLLLAERDSLLRVGRNPAGEVLEPDERAALEGRQAMFRELVEGFEEVEPVLPTWTFDSSLRLSVGNLTVELTHLGPAHSFGDLIVHIPDRRVVLAGDLLTLPFLGAGDGFSSIVGWSTALERIAELEAEVVVPGHGGPTEGNDAILDAKAMIDFVIENVRTGLTDGMQVDALVERLATSEFVTSRVGSQVAPFVAFFLEPAVAITARELREEIARLP